MLTMAKNLSTAARAAEKLISTVGADKVALVEQLTPDIFRARLVAGGVALAIVADDGRTTIRIMED